MSHYMTALAMRQKGLKPAAKIVLYWLADHYNQSTGECFPSHKRLAELCEMTDRNVRLQLDQLAKLGLVVAVKRIRDNGSQTSNSYQLTLVVDDHGRKIFPTPVENISTPPVHNFPTLNLGNINLGIEPSIAAQNKRACTLPEGWVVSNKNIQDALERNFSNEEIKHESHQFSNYHFSKGTKFKDWDAAWRTWLGNSRKFTKARSSRPSGGHDALMAGFAAYADRFGD
jgi:DNA-binding transcriptional MocR family regulator